MNAVAHLEKTLQKTVGDSFLQKKYLIAVSGGQDSMALLKAMCHLLPLQNITVAHFDHRTRGDASGKDAVFVARYCHQNGLECWVGERTGKGTSEASLREERWRFLRQLRRSTRADFIVTAHHLQDQLETFLMRFLRGSGLEGLAAMSPREKYVLRPWLFFPSSDLKKWAEENKVRYRKDATNDLPNYFRNRTRQRLLPELMSLASEFGNEAAFYQRFTGLSQELQTHRKKLRLRAKRAFEDQAVITPFWIRVSTHKKISSLLLREIYRRLKEELPSREKLAEIRTTLNTLTKKATIPGNILVEASFGSLFFQSQSHRQRQDNARQLHYHRNILKAPALGLELIVPKSFSGLSARFFEPGDRFREMKLKKYFAMHRIPSPERRFLPLLSEVGSSDVAWCYPQRLPELRVRQESFPFSFLENLKKQ